MRIFGFLVTDARPWASRCFLDETVGRLRGRKSAVLEPGVSEIQIAREVAAFYEQHDAQALAISVCFGANAAFPHHSPGSRCLHPDDTAPDRSLREVPGLSGRHGPGRHHQATHRTTMMTSWRSSSGRIEEGQVFSIEPGIYLPGRFGIRLEDVVMVRKDHGEILSGLGRRPLSVSA